ncbi:hypothetical protein ABFS82_08G127300 [Erythranthe guttata]|uniref:F-box domain-containing protein n=1 Tax=Erythranthe guttata TaxID=4155 RepID=A0A022RT55_ERYGU|nr:PREDICTED: putative F-box/LRR-repeat protein 23 [Erythranthe guttata]EYU43244.1 hypothetical protein MIMGU_mgv1a020320mg [Erythranthe guttata]|eukprot:XP_012830446.1 PREDICTED: putative F-box/LRR-repeat protein 23 [Erythranthe guttata]
MASSSSPVIESTPPPPWESLPPEITAAILQKLGAVEILMTAVKVCPTWWRVSKEYPSIWRCINMQDSNVLRPVLLVKMCRCAVDLSQGQLTEININGFGTHDMILYISERSSQLKSLQLVNCRGILFASVVEAITNFPLLEELHLQQLDCMITVNGIETIGISCPLLKSLSFCDRKKKSMNFNNLGFYDAPGIECDKIAEAIAQNMPGLFQLQLIGSKLTDVGLKAILCGCPNLVSLDLRGCFNVFTCADVEQLCLERIKDLKLPRDSMDGYDFGADDSDDSDDDYGYGYGYDCDYDNHGRLDDDEHYFGRDYDDGYHDPDDVVIYDNEYAYENY